MEILIAFLVMLSVALLAGILLSVFSYFFSVPENPVQKAVRECLPGINCGACGYKGCDDYAVALANGEAKANLCVPGAQDVADQISTILGVESEKFEDVVAFVACNGDCEATFVKAKYEGIKTCAAAAMLYSGAKSCSYGCLGLGDCAAVCPSDAICLLDGIARVNTARCIGCGLCSRTCPKSIISMIPQDASTVVMCSNKQKGADARKACKVPCIGCKKCEKVCQRDAITVSDNLASIDFEKCTHCGKCAAACPTGCLKNVFLPNIPEGVELEELID